MKEKSTEQHITDALSSIDNIGRATPTPFFYTRLMARLNQDQSSWGRIGSFIARPAIAFATILLVIFINVFAIYSNSDTNITNSDQVDYATVDEYSQVSSNIYDIENSKP